MIRKIKNLLFNNQGLAFVEFAILAPLFLVIFLGTFELSRFIIIMQRVERSTYSLSSIIMQYLPAQNPQVNTVNEISRTNMNDNIFPQLSVMMGEYGNAEDLRAIVTSVRRVGNTNRKVVQWQVASPDSSGSLANGKTVSIVNRLKPADIKFDMSDTPANFNATIRTILTTMQPNENMVVVEVFYLYKPLLRPVMLKLGMGAFAQQTMVSRSYTMPRYGSFLTLPN